MVDDQLVNWIRESSKAGYSADQIKTTLTQSGYSSQDIEEAMNCISPTPEKKSVSPIKRMRLWIKNNPLMAGMIIGGMLLVIGLLFAVSLF